MNEEPCCEQTIPNGVCAKSSINRGELLSQYEIRIKFVSLGCLISVGCKSFAFSTVEEGMKALNAYVENPVEECEKWIKLTN